MLRQAYTNLTHAALRIFLFARHFWLDWRLSFLSRTENPFSVRGSGAGRVTVSF
jgi:hypothetical protein